MSEVPHCPDCKRADKVQVRKGPTYEYYCSNCERIITPNDIVDGPYIDMVKDSMFRNPEEVKKKAEFEFSDKCECEYCQRGRPGLEEIRSKFKD